MSMQLGDHIGSSLSAGIDSSTTSWTLNDASEFKDPDYGYYWVRVWNYTDYPDPADDSDSEAALVTAVSSNTLTVIRGIGDNTAAAHNTGGKTYYVQVLSDAGNIMNVNAFNVLSWGLVGDGTTGFGTELQDCIDVVEAFGKGEIFFPPGDYVVDGDITVSDADVYLHFAPGAMLSIDDGFTVTLPSPDNIIAKDTQQIFDDSNTQFDGVEFTEGGRMSVGWWGAADGGNIKDSMQGAIYALNCAGKGTLIIPPGDYTYTTYDNAIITSPYNYIIGDCTGVKIEAVGARITWASTPTGTAWESVIRFINCSDVHIEGLYIDGNVATNQATGGYGFHLQSVFNFSMQNCHLKDFHYDCMIVTDDGTHDVPYGGSVKSCIFESGQRDSLTLSACRDWTFEGCQVIDAADTVERNSHYCGLAIEPNGSASYNVDNVTFKSCTFADAYGASVRITSNTGQCTNLTFDTCLIQMDTGAQGDAAAIILEADSISTVFKNCQIYGLCGVAGIAKFENCQFTSDGSITSAGGTAHQCLRFEATAGYGCSIRDCMFTISDNTSKRCLVLADRESNSEGWTLPIENCTFVTSGSTVSGISSIDLGNLYEGTNFDDTDIIYFKLCRFIHSGTSPGTPNYMYAATYDSHIIWGPGNHGSDDHRLFASGVTGWPHRLESADDLIEKRTYLLTDLTSSGTWTAAIDAGSMVLAITAEVTTEITGAGGWQVGDGSDADRWGTTSTLTVGTKLGIPAWTADTSAFITSASTNIVITETSGTFSAGAVELTVHLIRAE